MDKDLLCDSLMKWLQTFHITCPHETRTDVSDGIAMAQALAQISPVCFDDTWMSKLKTDVGSNWRLKVSNLKKILKGILDFYQESLGQQVTEFHIPDVTKIGEHSDAAELGRMLQLILGCAVNCSHKQEYIETIMGMEESVQQVIMRAIQELMTKEGSSAPGLEAGSEVADTEAQLRRVLHELDSATEAKELISQRCHELELQVGLLQEEKVNLLAGNERLNERLREMEALEGATTGTGHRYKELKKQMEGMQDEMYKLETSREDYRLKVEVLERELLELQSRQEELQRAADEARVLKDEVDILRETFDRVSKYEATIDSYKKKMEELSDLKRQVKILEEKNMDYVQQNMDLEEEIKKTGSWKPQVDMYKKQVGELHQKLGEETKKGDKTEFENKKLQEKLVALQREKERLIAERDVLKETNEELKCAQLNIGTRTSLATEPSSQPISSLTETDTLEMIGPEIKEKLLRLQHENKMLKLGKHAQDEPVPMLQSMIDDLKERQNELQGENRSANQRIMELESQVEELQEKLKKEEGRMEGGDGLKSMDMKEMQANLVESTEKTSSLQESLKRKDAEMQAMEERYKKYIEKAKSVIRTLDPKQNPGVAPEVSALRAQLNEKDRFIENLEREQEKNKAIKEMEERLLSTAFYNYGMQMQRQVVEQRLSSNINSSQSFLARQRQASSRRLGLGLGSSEFYDY